MKQKGLPLIIIRSCFLSVHGEYLDVNMEYILVWRSYTHSICDWFAHSNMSIVTKGFFIEKCLVHLKWKLVRIFSGYLTHS